MGKSNQLRPTYLRQDRRGPPQWTPPPPDFSQPRHPFNPSPPVTRRAVPYPSRPVTSRPTRPLPRSRCPRQPPSRAVAQPVAGALGSLGPRRGRRASERGREGARAGSPRMCVAVAWPAKAASPSPTDSHAPSEGVTGRKTLHRTLSHQGLVNTVSIRKKRRSVPILLFVFWFRLFSPFGCTALGSAGHPRPTHPHWCRCDVVGSIESGALGALGLGSGFGIGLVLGVKLS